MLVRTNFLATLPTLSRKKGEAPRVNEPVREESDRPKAYSGHRSITK